MALVTSWKGLQRAQKRNILEAALNDPTQNHLFTIQSRLVTETGIWDTDTPIEGQLSFSRPELDVFEKVRGELRNEHFPSLDKREIIVGSPTRKISIIKSLGGIILAVMIEYEYKGHRLRSDLPGGMSPHFAHRADVEYELNLKIKDLDQVNWTQHTIFEPFVDNNAISLSPLGDSILIKK